MTPERWLQIDQILEAAIEREPAERPAFVDQACAGDQELRREVESLLAAHEQAGNFIESPPAGDAAELFLDYSAKLDVGNELGNYRILSLLGAGGMGRVYLAQDMRLGRKVALKVLPALFSKDKDRVKRFNREARAVLGLNHPNILTIYEIGEVDGVHFMATEFIRGHTLREHLSQARLEIGKILDIAIQVATALDAAHAEGIIHRDVKPDNIMIGPDGHVKVLDFGLSKITEKQSGPDSSTELYTNPGIMMGTVYYMSPEQAQGVEVDARSDIWSLGCVIYEMIAGRRPFEGTTASGTIGLLLYKEPAPLPRYASEVPAELERIVTKALRKDREERYQVIKDLILDLKSLKHRLEFKAELELTETPGARTGAARQALTSRQDESSGRTVSSAEYLVGGIKDHKRSAIITLAALMVTAIAFTCFYFATGSQPVIGSIAVLPFTNSSGDPNTEYLSDGISESLINSISQLPGVKVIARSSSFKYKGKEVDPQEIARALGVETILVGRVVQRNDNLLISVELMDVRDKTHIWGEQYNRRAADLLQVQSDISSEIARKLRQHLSSSEQQRLVKHQTANPQAYELVLRGRFASLKGGTENSKKSVEYYQQAIKIDPNYAIAFAYLSDAYRVLVSNSVLNPEEYTPLAEAAALKALELDESLGDAHLALALIKQDAWEWASAERDFRRAIELNPNLARAHGYYSFFLSLRGRHEQAFAESKRARELDPLSPAISASAGLILYFARQYNQAIEFLKKALELDPNYIFTHLYLGYNHMETGLYPEALAAYEEAIKRGHRTPSTQIYIGVTQARAGGHEQARAILRRLQASRDYVSPVELATLYAALGEREKALSSLEKAYSAHDLQLQYLGVDPMLDNLRPDPRFQDLLRRIGLSQ